VSVLIGVALAAGSAAHAMAPSHRVAISAAGSATAMPLDRYTVSDAQVAAVTAARAELEVSCLRALGITPDATVAAVPSSASYPVFSPLTSTQATAKGYAALATPGVAAVGYVAGYDAHATKADPHELTALYGQVASVNGHQVPAGGCKQQAQRELQAGVGAVPDDPRGAQVQTQFEALQDPRMAAAFRSWSACMSQHSYHYATPLDAASDPRWAVNSTAGTTYRADSPAQTSAATTDAACQARAGVAATWTALNRTYQAKYVAAHGPALARTTAVVTGWLGNARRLGATVPLIAATTTAAGPAVVTGTAAPAHATPVWNGTHTYHNNATGLYLDSHGATCHDGNPIDGYRLEDGATNERWYYSQVFLGSGRILADEQCLTATSGPFPIEDHGGIAGEEGVDQWHLEWDASDGDPYDNELTDINAAYYGPSGYYILVNDDSGDCASEWPLGGPYAQGRTLEWVTEDFLYCAGGAAPIPSAWN
jgi:hypothetical protein